MDNEIKPRNDGTWSESTYWVTIRNALKRAFRYWRPMAKAKLFVRRPYRGPNKRQKWEYQCAHCKNWFQEKMVNIDYKTPAGSIKSMADIERFINRITSENPNDYQIICKDCFKIKLEKELAQNNANA
jgi:hypothetical protein